MDEYPSESVAVQTWIDGGRVNCANCRNLLGHENGQWIHDAAGLIGGVCDDPRPLIADDEPTCKWCGEPLTETAGQQWEDLNGDLYCAIHVEGCGACDDGQPHPHEPV